MLVGRAINRLLQTKIIILDFSCGAGRDARF